MPSTTHCRPNAAASSAISSGRCSAGELTLTLSAPADSTARAVSTIADPARDREGNVDHRGHPLDPAEVEAAAVGAGGDVVEDQLVGALVAIAQRMIDDVADVAMVAEPDALDHAAVGDVEAGDDPSRGHGRPLPRR